MKQSRLESFKESLFQTAVGYGVAIASQLYLFPKFDIFITFGDNLLLGGYFTLISVVRQYIIRRLHNNKVK
jgi:hypothetical protein